MRKRSCFCTQSEKIVGVTLSYETESDISQKEKSELEKDVSLNWVSEYIQEGDPTSFVDEAKIIYLKKASGSE